VPIPSPHHPLQAPSQAAPTGVTTTASSVSSPSGANTVPSTTASSVSSPNSSVSTPSTSSTTASSVSSPNSSSNPSTSASSVTPPVSSKPSTGGDVKPLGWHLFGGKCDFFDDGSKDTCTADADDLQRNADRIQAEADAAMGNGKPQEAANLQFLVVKFQLQRLEMRCPGTCLEKDSITNILNSKMYDRANPEAQFALWRGISYSLSTGAMGLKDFNAFADWWKKLDESIGKPSGQAADLLNMPLLPGVQPNSNNLGEAASFLLDFMPFVGDAKGILEGIFGKTMTGEQLSWFARGGAVALGIFGLFTGGLGSKGVKGSAKLGGAFLDWVKGGLKRVGCNSFTKNTKVWVMRQSQDSSRLKPVKTLSNTLKKVGKTILAAVAISSLQIGDKVLAYNESTDAKGTYEVTDVRSHEKPIYELKLETNTKKLETIETTAEHPFFVEKFGNSTPRPKAEGHEDLSSHWVGAKDLVKNDVLKRSSGLGRVLEVKRTSRVERVWNISVAEAGTYFVGDGQWLVHNCSIVALPKGGIIRDGMTMGTDALLDFMEEFLGLGYREVKCQGFCRFKVESKTSVQTWLGKDSPDLSAFVHGYTNIPTNKTPLLS
jgi:hypothetical protein